MKVLFLDIETSAHVVETWSLYKANIGLEQLREPTQMICVAAKWAGERKTHFWSLFHHDRDEMLRNIHQMMTDADVVVTYNGKSFDIPHLNREFITGGFPPPAPSKHIDLYLVARRHFKFASNKLAYVTQALGLSGKLQHSGYSLWKDCLEGKASAWKLMRKYNIQDVVVLEELYDKLKPWIWNGPNAQLYGSGQDSCPSCGSRDLRREGYAILTAGRYQRFQCKACSAWSRSNRREDSSNLKGVNPS